MVGLGPSISSRCVSPRLSASMEPITIYILMKTRARVYMIP